MTKPKCALAVLASVVLVGIAIVAIGHRPPAETRVFQEHVLKPVPASVDNIRFAVVKGSFGRVHLLRFGVSKAGIASILESKTFDELEWVSYRNYAIHWGYWGTSGQDPRENPLFGRRVESVAVHDFGQELPEWFRVNDWDNPKVYRFREELGRGKREHVQVLIYDETHEEACFVDHFAEFL